MGLFFVSDTHFYHYKDFLQRPFLGPEMDEFLISNWNSLVKNSDEIYHLGDFGYLKSVEDAKRIFDRLNGNKFLITGNHDSNNHIKKLRWSYVFSTKMLNYGSDHFFLSHYAHRTWPSKYRGAYHLYGHSHGKLPGFDRSMDVGVDAGQYKQKYFPISAEEVVKQLSPIEFKGKYDADVEMDAQ